MKRPPERPVVIVKDTREPDEAAGDLPEAVFRPCVFAPGTPRDTPWNERPKVVLPVERRALRVGDYSLPGLEDVVAIERKSGRDLLATLFGEGRTTALGEARSNQDRFRDELARARSMALFAIVCEASTGWLFTEARERWERFGKSFDPFHVLALLRSFAVDLGVPTIWAGSKGLAELEVGSTLARVWSQATGGEKARDARKRGYGSAWLGALEATCKTCLSPVGPCLCPTPIGQPANEGASCPGCADPACVPCNTVDTRPVDMDKVVAAFTEMREDGARIQAGQPPKLAPLGGMTSSTADAAQRRARKRRTG